MHKTVKSELIFQLISVTIYENMPFLEISISHIRGTELKYSK